MSKSNGVGAARFACLKEEDCIGAAYLALLQLPYGETRARCDRLLAGLRDEFARLTGADPEDVQTAHEFEALAITNALKDIANGQSD